VPSVSVFIKPEHLLAWCNFVEAVWNLIALRFGLPAYNLMAAEGGTGSVILNAVEIGVNGRKTEKDGSVVHFLVVGLEGKKW
jgi:hypothetical protein